MQFRTAYAPGKERYGTECSGESLTKQSFKDDADINKIVERYPDRGGVAGLYEDGREPMYLDVSSAESYQDSLNRVIAAEEAFAALPSKVRDRFSNDPSALLRFLDDSSNRKEAEELGLVEPKKVEPSKVEPAAPQQKEAPKS